MCVRVAARAYATLCYRQQLARWVRIYPLRCPVRCFVPLLAMLAVLAWCCAYNPLRACMCLHVQEKKQLVFEGTVGRDVEALGRLTEDDLRFLFG